MLKTLFLFSVVSTVFASPEMQDAASSVIINADSMECSNEEKICMAKGHAFAKRTEDGVDQTITADQFKVFLEDPSNENDQSNASPKLKEIHAVGGVVIKFKNTTLEADSAKYHLHDQKIYICGRLKIFEEPNKYIEGEEGEVDLSKQTYRVYSNGQQVHALFNLASK